MGSPSKKRRGMSLKLKLTLGLVLIIGALFAGFNTFSILRNIKKQRDAAIVANKTVARLVYGSLVGELPYNEIHSERIRTVVENFLQAALSLNQENRDLAYAVVVDNYGQVMAGKAKVDLVVFPGGKRMNDERKTLMEIARLEGKLGSVMRTTRFPLQVAGKEPVGRLLVGTSLERIEAEGRKDLLLNGGAFVLALLAMIAYATFILGRVVVSPIQEVVSAMREVQDGRLDVELDMKRKDEIGELATTYNFMVHGLREREQLKDAFSRYVSKQVYQKMQAGAIKLTGETRNATILFSDIRSFTSISEQLTPSEVVSMLNEYFTEMVEIIFKYDGFLNKFIGDAIMAVYNVPLDQEEPELRAVKTALEMVISLEKLNTRRQARGQDAIKIGIGVNTGPVVAGNLGHEQRLEYTVIGDAVNLAQRLESQTKVAGATILISDTTYKVCGALLQAQKLPPVKVKGKQENVTLYAVTGLADGTLAIAQPSKDAANNVAAAQILEHG